MTLAKIHKDLRDFRYEAMDEGDLRTNLICVTNSLLNLMSYLEKSNDARRYHASVHSDDNGGT